MNYGELYYNQCLEPAAQAGGSHWAGPQAILFELCRRAMIKAGRAGESLCANNSVSKKRKGKVSYLPISAPFDPNWIAQ